MPGLTSPLVDVNAVPGFGVVFRHEDISVRVGGDDDSVTGRVINTVRRACRCIAIGSSKSDFSGLDKGSRIRRQTEMSWATAGASIVTVFVGEHVLLDCRDVRDDRHSRTSVGIGFGDHIDRSGPGLQVLSGRERQLLRVSRIALVAEVDNKFAVVLEEEWFPDGVIARVYSLRTRSIGDVTDERP